LSKKPVLASAPPPRAERPRPGHVPAKEKWVFSFRFWRQIENFQVGGVKNSWYISLLERLAEVSQIDREEMLRDAVLQGGIRFHEIDWNAKNVPLRRSDLDWLDKDYLKNEEEYPIYQFHVSKALGRVVGFFDERQIFNIVLLDPNHNIQPSDYNDYRIRPTIEGSCQFSQIVSVARRSVAACSHDGCAVRSTLVEALVAETTKATGGVVVLNLRDDLAQRLRELQKRGLADSLDEVLTYAIEEFESLLDH
jgi:hypothetical protein